MLKGKNMTCRSLIVVVLPLLICFFSVAPVLSSVSYPENRIRAHTIKSPLSGTRSTSLDLHHIRVSTVFNREHTANTFNTSKHFDTETGLTDFGARQVEHERAPRFTSPDPTLGANFVLTNPQTFNLYTYGLNNPLKFIDPNGEETVLIFTTERNPRRDSENPWGNPANFARQQAENQYAGQFESFETKILDVNRVSQVQEALKGNEDIVEIFFIGHASQRAINVGNEDAPDTNISSRGGKNDVSPNALDWSNLSKNSTITIWGCNTGAGNNSIAQGISNASGSTVTAPDSSLNFSEEGRPFIRWFRGDFKTFTSQKTEKKTE